MSRLIWRYERKYRIEWNDPKPLMVWLRQHPAGFSESYPQRQINNIYYDTPELRCFAENMAGVNQRSKYRIRWYGTDGARATHPRLAVKMKHNELGAKQYQVFDDFEISNPPSLDDLKLMDMHHLSLVPALMNRYRRAYYESADSIFRMTIDYDLAFRSVHDLNFHPRTAQTSSSLSWHALPDLIMELKYSRDADHRLDEITRYLPFRQTKMSKYAVGIGLIH